MTADIAILLTPDARGWCAPVGVRASFEFLLEREPKESILGDFEIGVIARYFPEYEREMRARFGR